MVKYFFRRYLFFTYKLFIFNLALFKKKVHNLTKNKTLQKTNYCKIPKKIKFKNLFVKDFIIENN